MKNNIQIDDIYHVVNDFHLERKISFIKPNNNHKNINNLIEIN